MIAGIAWFIEFSLAVAGCVFFFRRRLPVLWIWLGFRALSDIACFLALVFRGSHAYNWADYVQRHIQYVLIAAAVMYVVGMILREGRETRLFYAFGSSVVAVWAIVQFHAAYPLTAQSVWIFETWIELIICSFACVAMGVMNGRAPKPWGLTACGLVALAGSDGLLNAMRVHGWHVKAYYPIGAIVGLGLLLWAGLFGKIQPTWELRLGIPQRTPDHTMWFDNSAEGQVQ